MVRILQSAGVNFAVMAEERCHADWARRAGEEYLFQTAVQENIENFAKYSFKRVLTTCPHCFNTLKNEYPQFEGAPKDVISHVQFIDELIRSGKLSPNKKEELGDLLTVHDACYFARYNGITEEPRHALRSAGFTLAEADSNGCSATCCGAGGGQIFMDRPSRINVIRLKELRNTGASQVAVSCPHCLTMLESAAAAQNDGSNQSFADISELIAQRLPEKNSHARG
jgi:Fe-S oxidoreductase